MVIEQREACEKAQDVFWNRPIIEGDPPHGPRHPCGSLRRCSPISHSHNHVVFASTIVLGRHCCCLSTHNPRRSRSEPSSSPTSAVIMAEEDDWETVSPLITCLPIPKPRHAAQLYRTTPTKLIHSPGGPLECRPLQTQIIEARTIPPSFGTDILVQPSPSWSGNFKTAPGPDQHAEAIRPGVGVGSEQSTFPARAERARSRFRARGTLARSRYRGDRSGVGTRIRTGTSSKRVGWRRRLVQRAKGGDQSPDMGLGVSAKGSPTSILVSFLLLFQPHCPANLQSVTPSRSPCQSSRR
jgi:hypothetical protein